MVIAVTTPTGNVGSRLVPLLVQAGERPRLLVRSASTLAAELLEDCDVVEVDLGDVEGVVRATAGVDALYWVDPPTGDDDPIAGYVRMGESGATAVRENGINRVVFQSSGGAEARSGFGEIDGLGATENLLDTTGAAVTHLRCGYFFSNLLMDLDSIRAGELSTTLPLDLPVPWVDPRDIAEVAAVRLLSTSWSGRSTQGLHGPADLTFSDVARIVGDAIGRHVVALQVSDSDVQAQLRSVGMTEQQVAGIVGMSKGMRSGFTFDDRRSPRTTTPTTLGAWAYSTLRPLL